MVGFIQYAVTDALMRELREYDPDLEMRAIKAWNKLCMVILEMLARAYGHEREAETFDDLLVVDPQAILEMSIDSYEKGLGIRRLLEYKDVVVASAEDIPNGERKIVQVDGLSIGVFHYEGEWYALHNSCLHRGGPVATGDLVGGKIICPWHGYAYYVTDGRLDTDPSARLEMYPVTIEGGQVILKIPVLALTTEGFAMDPSETTMDRQIEGDKPELRENEFNIQDIPTGNLKLLRIGGRRIAVYNVDGLFYATDDECTHSGGPLSEGELEGKVITCPWHGSCFDVTDGSVQCRPAVKPVKTFRVTVDGEIGRVE
jgi:nitrite reductase/ring-hydroxylating ferredoxin subunit